MSATTDMLEADEFAKWADMRRAEQVFLAKKEIWLTAYALWRNEQHKERLLQQIPQQQEAVATPPPASITNTKP
jgi:hypothetical protein